MLSSEFFEEVMSEYKGQEDGAIDHLTRVLIALREQDEQDAEETQTFYFRYQPYPELSRNS